MFLFVVCLRFLNLLTSPFLRRRSPERPASPRRRRRQSRHVPLIACVSGAAVSRSEGEFRAATAAAALRCACAALVLAGCSLACCCASVADVDHSRRGGNSVERQQRKNVQKGEKKVLGPQGLHCYITRVITGVLGQHFMSRLWRGPPARGPSGADHTCFLCCFFFLFFTSDVTVTEHVSKHVVVKLSVQVTTQRSSVLSLCRFPGDRRARAFMAFLFFFKIQI